MPQDVHFPRHARAARLHHKHGGMFRQRLNLRAPGFRLEIRFAQPDHRSRPVAHAQHGHLHAGVGREQEAAVRGHGFRRRKVRHVEQCTERPWKGGGVGVQLRTECGRPSRPDAVHGCGALFRDAVAAEDQNRRVVLVEQFAFQGRFVNGKPVARALEPAVDKPIGVLAHAFRVIVHARFNRMKKPRLHARHAIERPGGVDHLLTRVACCVVGVHVHDEHGPGRRHGEQAAHAAHL